MRWLPKRGPWIPQVPYSYGMATNLFLGFSPVVIGIDYILGENESSVSELEKSFPFWGWGVLMILYGLGVLYGYLFRRSSVCIHSLWLSGSIFFALAIGVAWSFSANLHERLVDHSGNFKLAWFYLVMALSSFVTSYGYAEKIREINRLLSGVEDAS